MNLIQRRLSTFVITLGILILAAMKFGPVTMAADDEPLAVPASANSKTDPAQQDRIQSLVDQLGSENFQQREDAEKKLAEIGLATFSQVLAAIQSDDPEIASRAARIMKELEKLRQQQRTEAIRKNVKWQKTFNDKSVKKVTALSVNEGLIAYGLNGWGVEWLDAKTGEMVGRSFIGGNSDLRKPVIADGKIFVGSGQPNSVRAFDAKTGKILWSAQLGQASSRPAVANGHVYVIEADAGGAGAQWGRIIQLRRAVPAGAQKVPQLAFTSKLVAFDTATGKRIWETKHDKALVGHPATTQDGRVVALRSDGHLIVIDAKTGKIQSQIKLDKKITNSSPSIDRGTAFVRTAGSVVAIDLNKGKIKWSYATPGGVQAVAGRIAVRQIIVVNGRVVRMGTSGSEAAPPAIGNGKLFFSSGSKVYALDTTTGQLQWQASIKPKQKNDDKKANNANVAVVRIRFNGINGNTLGMHLAQPTIAGDMIMVGGSDGLHGLDAKTGKQLWMFETNGVIEHRAVVRHGIAYFGVNRGQAEQAARVAVLRQKGVGQAPHAKVEPSIYSVKLMLTPVER